MFHFQRKIVFGVCLETIINIVIVRLPLTILLSTSYLLHLQDDLKNARTFAEELQKTNKRLKSVSKICKKEVMLNEFVLFIAIL